jgi:PAS domain S-box-containing protein
VLVENREAGPREVRFIALDGTIVEVEVRCNPMQYGGRRLVQTTIVDLTERKQAESALRESEEKFRQITENAAEVFWLNEINPRTLRYISPAFESIWGITVEEVMSTPGRFFDTIHPDDRARVEKTAAGNTTGFNHEFRIVRPDGTIRWVHDRAYPVRDASGRTVRIAGVAEDITDAKAAEEALRHTTRTQQLLLSELDHRVKNSLTSLVTLIDLTSAETEGVREFADSIRARVLAMSSVHSLLSEGHWSPVPLERVVRALSPPETIGTIEVEGPPVDVPARQVTAFAMIVQELFTNSLKYGAAGHAAGLVSVKWNIEEGSATHNSSPRLHLRWHESNVPAIALPATPGVGTRLIQGFCKFELNGRANFEYHANEVRHNFMFTLDNDPPPLPDPKLIRSDAAPASDFSHVTLRNPA